MSGLLYGVGAFAAVAGAIMIGFGIPVGEFSFGNALIVGGIIALVGGLIVLALGVVVAQLQRLTDVMANRAPMRTGRPPDMFDAAPGARMPLPGRPRILPKSEPELGNRGPEPFVPRDVPQNIQQAPVEAVSPPDFAANFAPTLRNPDEPPVMVEDDVLLSPMQPAASPAPATADFGASMPVSDFKGSGMAMPGPRLERPDHDWRPAPAVDAPEPSKPPQTAYFDAMWPEPSKPARGPAAEKPEAAYEPEPASEAPTPEPEEAAVAILKSGIVDGMGYTLYVDGSIEAELPQGTLRFASINELRSHLENNA